MGTSIVAFAVTSVLAIAAVWGPDDATSRPVAVYGPELAGPTSEGNALGGRQAIGESAEATGVYEAADPIGAAVASGPELDPTAPSAPARAERTAPPEATAQTGPAPSVPVDEIDPRLVAAIERVDIDVALWGWSIEQAGPRNSTQGEASFTDRTIRIYLRDAWGPDEVAWVLAHEIGHVIDFECLDDSDRERFAARRGYDARVWWGSNSAPDDFHMPAGDFAEVFAMWRLWMTSPFGWQSAMAGEPDEFELVELGSIVVQSMEPSSG